MTGRIPCNEGIIFWAKEWSTMTYAYKTIAHSLIRKIRQMPTFYIISLKMQYFLLNLKLNYFLFKLLCIYQAVGRLISEPYYKNCL